MGNIIFWDINNRNLGGIERIILTMTMEFSRSKEVVVISHPNSTVLKLLEESKAKYTWLRPDKNEIKNRISQEDLLIIFYTFEELKLLKASNPRLLIWNVFPPQGKSRVMKHILESLELKELIRKNSILTMDPYCRNTFKKRFGVDLSDDYLKIPIAIKSNLYKYRIKEDTVNITYIGRGNEMWKIKPVKKLLSDLCTIKGTRYIIHIFTDDNYLFESELSKIVNDNTKVLYYFNYWGNKLHSKLLEISDVHYSMGTSMLEGASLGIPTIIADAAMMDFPTTYKYRWFIDDVENYAGIFVDQQTNNLGYSVKELIAHIFNSARMVDISLKQFEYISNTFSPNRTAKKILEIAPDATVRTLMKYHPRLWF